MEKIILASQSPRRQEILSLGGYEYEVCVSSAEEQIPPEELENLTPQELVEKLARVKAEDVYRRNCSKNMEKSTTDNQAADSVEEITVIGADTVVAVDGCVLGKPKTEALPEVLYRINPYLVCESRCEKVMPENVRELFADYPIVCEAFDRPDQKAMLVRELLMQCPETTVISGNGMAGYGDANEIRTRQKMKRLYVCGDLSTDVGGGIGLMAPRVAVCAAHEANKAVQLIMEQ